MPKKKVEDLHQLSDIEVLTVGLVSHGANREDFFIRKEADMSEEELLLEKEEPQGDKAEGFLAKLRKAWRSDMEEVLVAKAGLHPKAQECLTKACKELQKGNDVLPPEVQKMLAKMQAMVDAQGYGYPEPAKKAAQPNPEDAEDQAEAKNPALEAEEEPKEKAVKKAEEEVVSKVELPPEVTAQLAALQKSQEDLVAELQKARDNEFRATYVQKAAGITVAPVAQTDLAEQLMFLAKSDPNRAEWWLNVLKTIDHQMSDAGIFLEKGRASAEDQGLLDELGKSGKDLRSAMLEMSPDSANAYLSERRLHIHMGR